MGALGIRTVLRLRQAVGLVPLRESACGLCVIRTQAVGGLTSFMAFKYARRDGSLWTGIRLETSLETDYIGIGESQSHK